MSTDDAWARAAGMVWPVHDGATALTEARRAEITAATEAYQLVRFGGRVRFVVDHALSRRARRRVLLYGNSLRAPRRRLARAAVASAFQLGRLPGHSALAAPHRDTLGLRRRVARALSRCENGVHLSFAVLDREGPPRATVLAVDPDGTPLMFLKVGAGSARRAALRRERAAIVRSREGRPPGVELPGETLWAEVGDVTVLGIEPLPADVTPVGPDEPNATWGGLDALVAGSAAEELSLAESPWLRARCRAARALAADPRPEISELGARCVKVTEAYATRHRGTRLPHGMRHGDWSFWNLGWTGGGAHRRLVAWDWEYSEASAPLALDRHNWHYARQTSVAGLPAVRAAADLLADARPVMAGGVQLDELTARLYLVDMAVRRSALAAAGERRSALAADGLLQVVSEDLT